MMWEDTEAEDAKFCLELLHNDALLTEEDVLDQVEASLGLDIVPENSMGDAVWENIDPTPDIHALFLELNRCYFANTLESCTVSWSTRMTSCAGLCRFEGQGGLCSISLSERLLKFRPRKDLLETLLHEMIHAYLFLTSADRDREEHGPHFMEHMKRINAKSGLNITIYHDFHEEVDFYKKHVWQCNGPCANCSPRFGVLRRATNRDPNKGSERGSWASQHKQFCGGTYIKLASPNKPPPAPKKVFKDPTMGLKSVLKDPTMRPKSVLKDPTMGPKSYTNPIGIQRYFKPIDVGGHGLPNPDGDSTKPVDEVIPIKPTPRIRTNESSGKHSNGNGLTLVSPKHEPASKRKKISWSSEDINEWLMAGVEVPAPTNGYIDDDIDVRKIQPDPNDLACKTTHDLIVQLGYKLDSEGNIIDRLQTNNPSTSHGRPILHTSPPPINFTRTPQRVSYSDTVSGQKKVACPICDQLIVETKINLHLDECTSSYGQSSRRMFATDDFHRRAAPEADEVAVCPVCETYIIKSALELHATKCATDRFGCWFQFAANSGHKQSALLLGLLSSKSIGL